MKRKKKQRKTARGIFRSLAPLLGTAGSLSDCGLNPTLPESDCSRLAALVLCAPLLVAHASGSANSWRLLLQVHLQSAISVNTRKPISALSFSKLPGDVKD